MRRFRRTYGTTPLHLLAHLACFALTAYVIAQVFDTRGALNLLLWFLGALVLHDLVLLPAYSLLDRAAARTTAPRGAVNHVRVPAAIALVLFLVYFPSMIGKGDGAYAAVAGVEREGELRNWLLICAALFAVSALLYLLRGRAASRGRGDARGPAAPPPPPSRSA